MKKILILSNNPVSTTSSNGRTMLNMLHEFKQEQLFNIFVSGTIDSSYCNYYQINDSDALKGFFGFRNIGRIPDLQHVSKNLGTIKNKKTALKVFIRNVVWNNSRVKKIIKAKAKEFAPDVILIQVGDCSFMIKIALYLQKTLNIPIVVYNSEDYYFKTWNYIEPIKKGGLFFGKVQKEYKNIFEILMSKSFASIYLTDDLKALYDSSFNQCRSFVIYNSAFSPKDEDKIEIDKSLYIYSGNISVGRDVSLLRASKVIFDLTSCKLTIYSTDKNADSIKKLSSCPYINFRGAISYDENISLLKRAVLCLHVEGFETFYLRDTKHAFSGKIPDSLQSGRPFVFFGPSSTTCYKYLVENGCGFVSTNEKELANIITGILNNDKIVETTLKNARAACSKNHNRFTNSKLFRSIMDEAN